MRQENLQRKITEKVKTVMNLAAQYVYVIGVLCRPFIPFTSDKIARLLNVSFEKEDKLLLNLMNKMSRKLPLKSGHVISQPEHIFLGSKM